MSSDTRIHVLRVAATSDCRAAVASALERVDWSLSVSDEVLFLRRLHVGGPLPEIGRLALRRAQDIGAHAISGWEAWAESAEAVRFTDQADLRACLLRDLANQRRRWFWRGWHDLFGLRSGQAIVRAMQTEVLRWPAVMDRLERNGDLAAVWCALRPADAQTLLHTMQQATGWRLNLDPRSLPGTGAYSTDTSLAGLSPPAWLSALDFPASEAAEAEDERTHERTRLAVVTWLWRMAPQMLARSDAASRVAMLARMLTAGELSGVASGVASFSPPQAEQSDTPSRIPARRDTDRVEHQTPVDTPARRTQSEQFEVTAAGRAETQTPPPTLIRAEEESPVEDSGDLPSDAKVGVLNPANQVGHTASRATDRLAAAPSPLTVLSPSAAAIQLLPRVTSGDLRCVTRQGGWFLLLNVLALPALRAWRELENPWIGLYRLGSALGGIADAPLARFLADLADLPDAAALRDVTGLLNTEQSNTEQSNTKQPSTKQPSTELLAAARAGFGDLLGTSHGAPDFLQLPALVIASASHLDVHFRMTDLRLDVRRVALDVNPGWLPWLGRVVNFHYGNAPELIAMDTP